MIKRPFGMAFLTISQGRYNSYSHKDINKKENCGKFAKS